MIYRLVILLFLGFIAFANPLSAQNTTNFYKGSFEMLKQKAVKENKPYFVAFHIPGCVPCKQMNDQVYTNPEIAVLANNKYIPFKISKANHANEILRRKYNVNQFPTIVFFDANGNEKGRVVGFRGKTVFTEDLKKYSPKQAHTNLTGFR